MGKDPRATSTIIYLALLGGMLAFAAVTVMIERSVPPPENLPAELLIIISASVAFTTILASQVVSRMMLTAARTVSPESARMAAGLRAFIIRMALMEVGSFVALVSYLFSGETVFLGIFAVVLVAFMIGRPTDSEWERVQTGSEAISDSTTVPPSIS